MATETTIASHAGYVMPPLKLINEEIITSSGLGSSSNGSPHRIIVTNLTASWSHVSLFSCVCIIRVFIGEGEAGIEHH